jgi:hypothetical protein
MTFTSDEITSGIPQFCLLTVATALANREDQAIMLIGLWPTS